MNAARDFCRGLRIIRQPKWECLATFICSSMKQVAHIRQISLALRKRFGDQRSVAEAIGLYVSAGAANRASFREGIAQLQARLSREKPSARPRRWSAPAKRISSPGRGFLTPSFENGCARCQALVQRSQIASCSLPTSGCGHFRSMSGSSAF